MSQLFKIAPWVACIILLILLLKSCEGKRNLSDMYSASQDTLVKTRDELGRETSTISVLNGSISDLQSLNSSKDSTLRQLQALVDRKTNSATIVRVGTSGVVTVTTTIARWDTVKDKVYPVYTMERKNQWEDISAIASNDSFEIEYKVFNDFEIVEKWEREKPWRIDKKLVLSIKNLNPHTETREIKTFTVKPKKVKRWAWLGGGVLGGFLLNGILNK